MSFPDPRPGLVIRYSYLWKREEEAGREEGVKERPCAIILMVRRSNDRERIAVLPITHSSPSNADDAVLIPREVKSRLGLDPELSWIVMSEVNVFSWPGPDLRPLPGRELPAVAYGLLPPDFYRHLRNRFMQRVRRRLVATVNRTE